MLSVKGDVDSKVSGIFPHRLPEPAIFELHVRMLRDVFMAQDTLYVLNGTCKEAGDDYLPTLFIIRSLGSFRRVCV